MKIKGVCIALLIAGVLAFVWCGMQIGNLPPDWVMPGDLVQKYHRIAAAYRVGQVISVVAAVLGGVGLVRQSG